MTQETQAGVSGGDAVAGERVGFTYNTDGSFNTITRYADTDPWQLITDGDYSVAATGTYGFDHDGNMTSLSYTLPSGSSGTAQSYVWQYDAVVSVKLHTLDFRAVLGTGVSSFLLP